MAGKMDMGCNGRRRQRKQSNSFKSLGFAVGDRHWLNGSCISLCLLNKRAVLRPSLSLKVAQINQIFLTRSFVVGAGVYVVNSKARPGSCLGFLRATI